MVYVLAKQVFPTSLTLVDTKFDTLILIGQCSRTLSLWLWLWLWQLLLIWPEDLAHSKQHTRLKRKLTLHSTRSLQILVQGLV